MQLIISLGANLGDVEHNLSSALEIFVLAIQATSVQTSSIYTNRAVVHPDNPKPQPPYANLAFICHTTQTPEWIMSIAKNIEADFGRDFSAPIWSPRPIDIDIIDYGGIQWYSNRLILPHPRAHLRDFVLRPLQQIAPQSDYIRIAKITPHYAKNTYKT